MPHHNENDFEEFEDSDDNQDSARDKRYGLTSKMVKRRASDRRQSENTETLFNDIIYRIEVLERAHATHNTAYPVNDLNKPDYDGHRKAHIEMTDERKVVEGYKNDATKKIIGIVLIFLVGALGKGVIDKLIEIAEHIK